MKYEEFKNILISCTKISKEFKCFYNEFVKLFEEKRADVENKLKIETDEFYYFFDVWPIDKQKNQKQSLFLISKYDKEKVVLYNSFRFDIEILDNIVLHVTNWKKEDDDYKTITKEIVLNSNDLII